MTAMFQLFLSFFKIGLLGFGGGMAIISLINEEIQKFAYISAEEFANMVAISQATPGPIAVNIATFVGYYVEGYPGAFVATLGVALPCFIITMLVCKLIGSRMDNKYIKGALSGVKPACVAMLINAAWVLAIPAIAGSSRIGGWFENLPFDPAAVLIAAITVIAVGKYKKNPIGVLIIMGCIGALIGI